MSKLAAVLGSVTPPGRLLKALATIADAARAAASGSFQPCKAINSVK